MAGFTAARVLIIDGDVGTLLSYKTILRAAGHEVTTVALGEDGIAAARREMFDVVFSDLLLPDVSGLDVIRSIRQASPSTGIVMVSGWATTGLFHCSPPGRRHGLRTQAAQRGRPSQRVGRGQARACP